MATVSLCMIVRNEADVLDRCLRSVADLVDEIILVDTGSTDGTKGIARKYTEKIFDYTWKDDFASARNASFSKASCDYCMWLDADDVLPDGEAFLQLKSNLGPETDVVMMPYHVGFDEMGNVTFSYYRERIIKNRAGMEWKGRVHEVLETHGSVLYSDCAVEHRKLHMSDPDRNLRIYESMMAAGEKLDAREQYYYARELYYHKRYAQALLALESFLENSEGWMENKIEACRTCALCFYGLGDEEKALNTLFRSFTYDLPRAEICCDIGNHFFSKECWAEASYWYHRALECERKDKRGGFVSPDAYGYLPYIQLCVCYSRLGRDDLAEHYNEQAAVFKPNDSAVLYNRTFFASLHE